MKHSIRTCEGKDLPRVIDLCEQHARYERAGYSRSNKLENLAELLFAADASLHCWIVETDGAIIGYATYTFDYSTWDAARFLYLDCLYLEEGYRGFGIGEEIMQRLFAIAEENKCVNIQWQTPTFNERAIKFYRRIGAIGNKKVRFSIKPWGIRKAEG